MATTDAGVLPQGEVNTMTAAPLPRREAARRRFPPRPLQASWATTGLDRASALAYLTAPPFALTDQKKQQHRTRSTALLLDWLEEHPGSTWQERWLASGIEQDGSAWRGTLTAWLETRGRRGAGQTYELSGAATAAVSADLLRPSLAWLVSGATGKGVLVRNMSRSRDPHGFAQLREVGGQAEGIRPAEARLALHRTAMVLAAKGGRVRDIAIGDVLEVLDAEAADHVLSAGTVSFYHLLHRMGVFAADAPATLREARSAGQRTPEELVDRYQLACRPIRDLLVDYLRERQPALDYTSLTSLSYLLGKLFWRDIERHHPGIDTLDLPAVIATAWKERLRTKTKTITTAAGDRAEVAVERLSYRETLTPVRAFYLDLAQWALEDPARWGPWVARSPVGAEEVSRRKQKRRVKARMDARTRERLPALPVLVRTVDQRRKAAAALLEAAGATPPGQLFTAAGQSLLRAVVPHAAAGKTWAEDPATGKRRDLGLEEEHAFWAWAAVEVLRATGVRIEELLELSHHSLVQYRLPTTGELVPLLQIAPSKTDMERLIVVSPELADVLSTVISRVRTSDGKIPLVRTYDRHECTWLAPAPLLFQRRVGTENRGLNDLNIRDMLSRAIVHTGLSSAEDGGPLHYTPHDFRRLFITDAVLGGLPPHIAQVIAGHRDINVTLGYKAVYPEEAVQAHLAFLARRRSLRPSEEYHTPTAEEWEEFLGHFERRKVSLGACGRAFGTPCIHEHACVRCPMLWPDPVQRDRLVEIRDNLLDRIAEAECEGWLGEIEGLRISLAGAEDKLTQINRRTSQTVDLPMPTRTTTGSSDVADPSARLSGPGEKVRP